MELQMQIENFLANGGTIHICPKAQYSSEKYCQHILRSYSFNAMMLLHGSRRKQFKNSEV